MQYMNEGGVHILLGVKNGDGFDVIWVDTSALLYDGTGSYQPQEVMRCWWEVGGDIKGTVIGSGNDWTTEVVVDMRQPAETGKFEWWTTLVTGTREWITSAIPPGSFLVSDGPRDAEMEEDLLVPLNNSKGDRRHVDVDVEEMAMDPSLAQKSFNSTDLDTEETLLDSSN